MTQIVFVKPNKINVTPFTTSDIIAKQTKINYRSVQRTIEKHEKALSTFGRVRFEITPSETNGGMQDKKVYLLNEEQATLLVTFLRNNDVVVAFKTELVRQFYAMRTELQRRQMLREQLKPIRRELTDVIKDKPDMGVWGYKQCTDLAYKTALGMNAAQVRKARGATQHARAIDYMTSAEIAAVAKLQSQIGTLLEVGMDYHQIKALLVNKQMVGMVSAGRE